MEAKAAIISSDEERLHHERVVNELSSQVGILKDQLRDLNVDKLYPRSGDEVESLKTQIQEVTKQLLKKQGQVVELQAEKSALKSRIQDLQNRCQTAERKTEHHDVEDDEEAYEVDSYRSNQSSTTLRKRGGVSLNNNIVDNLEKYGVKPAPGVAKAVDIFDTWTLVTVRFLRSHPLVRLFVVAYLLVLHIWVFLVLAIHTHSLELDTDPRDIVLAASSK